MVAEKWYEAEEVNAIMGAIDQERYWTVCMAWTLGLLEVLYRRLQEPIESIKSRWNDGARRIADMQTDAVKENWYSIHKCLAISEPKKFPSC